MLQILYVGHTAVEILLCVSGLSIVFSLLAFRRRRNEANESEHLMHAVAEDMWNMLMTIMVMDEMFMAYGIGC